MSRCVCVVGLLGLQLFVAVHICAHAMSRVCQLAGLTSTDPPPLSLASLCVCVCVLSRGGRRLERERERERERRPARTPVFLFFFFAALRGDRGPSLSPLP